MATPATLAAGTCSNWATASRLLGTEVAEPGLYLVQHGNQLAGRLRTAAALLDELHDRVIQRGPGGGLDFFPVVGGGAHRMPRGNLP